MNSLGNSTSFKTQIIVIIILALIASLANYLHFQEFGLYEDDYYFISPAFQWSFSDLIRHAQNVLVTWPEGRPVAFILPQAITFIGRDIGGLKFAYAIGYCILALNAGLFYSFARRVGPPLLAVFSAIAFVLFPADTTKSFVTHALQLQVSIAFYLVAALCYLSGNPNLRRLSYLIAPLCLITREEPFLPFILLPLLDGPWNQRWARGAAAHLAISLATLVVYSAIRFGLGDARVHTASTSLSLTIANSIAGMLIGPAAALISFPYRFLTVVQQFNGERLWVTGLSFGLLLPVLSRFASNRLTSSGSDRSFDTKHFSIRLSAQVMQWLSYYQVKIAVVSLLMISFSYALAFRHYPPTNLSGRVASVHLAASIGAALFMGWLCNVLTDIANRLGRRWLALAGAAFFFSMLTGFGLIVQQDYADSWRIQQLQWSTLLPLIADAEENTFIFVVSDNLPKTRYIQTHTSFSAQVMAQLFQFPAEWAAPPRVVFFEKDWNDTLNWTDAGLEWIADYSLGNIYPVSDGNVILIEVTDNHWQRREGTIVIHGYPVRLKPIPASVMQPASYQRLPLYNLLIQESVDP